MKRVAGKGISCASVRLSEGCLMQAGEAQEANRGGREPALILVSWQWKLPSVFSEQ